MKRIISIFLCVAMLMSMVVISASAWDEDVASQIETENIVSYTLNKETYAAGDEVLITVSMDEIWGDPDLVGTIPGFAFEAPGAYGMALLAPSIAFPTDVFEVTKSIRDYAGSSDIYGLGKDPNGDKWGNTITKTDTADANAYGFMTALVEAKDIYTYEYEDEDTGDYVEEKIFGLFQGSGKVVQFRMNVKEDALPGTYKIPLGSFQRADGAADSEYEFFGNYFKANGFVDGSANAYGERPITFVSATDEYVNDDPSQGAYVTIVIEGGVTAEDEAAAAEVDALIDAIGTDIWAAGNALKIDSYNNINLYTHTGDTDAIVNSQNFSIKFKMMPGKNTDDKFGFFGGWTEWNGGADVIFWNNAAKKFMIGAANGPVNCSEVTNIKAESPELALPEKQWTDVEFIYNGSYMAVKVNGITVCSTNNASTGYSFYIFYPSGVEMYIADMFVGDYDYDAFLAGANGAYTNVVLDSGAAIVTAETAYENLTAIQKTLVTKYDVLTAARAEYDALADTSAVDALNASLVDTLIDAIGTVDFNPWDASADDAAAIAAAEAAYAGLSDSAKALVTKYDVLTAARAEYDATKEAFDRACAYDVDVLIDAIGEVNFGSRAAIEEAEAAYAALTDAQKAFVTKYDVLVAARATYDQYAPIMNVEVLADALGADFFQGFYTYQSFTSTNGYADVRVTTDVNITGDFELNTEFVYTAANLHETDDSGIALFRSDATYAGYNFKLGAFIVGKGGAFMSGNKTPEVIASTEYDLVEGKVYNMTIKFQGTVASVYLDGELMVTADGGAASYDYTIFYPMNANIYFSELTATADGKTANLGFATPAGTAGIDVLAPVDIEAKLVAAETALAALDADQLALLDDKYETIIAEARANYDAKLAEVQANADAVEALIAAIATEADANAARAAYQALTPGAQTLVENYADLNNALANITIGYIDAIGEVTPDSEAAIAKAEAAYGALTPAERELVTNYDVLTAARAEINAQYTAIANAEAAIAMLQAGGSAIVNFADGGSAGSYSQYLDNAENLAGGNAVEEYVISFDVNVVEISDAANSYIGGSSANEVFVGYDLVRKTVFVAKAGPWGYNSAIDASAIIAEAAFDLQLNTWYDFKFVMGNSAAQIYVDGELVLETAITEPNGWFIYYPKNNVSYYDNIEFWYNGEKQTSMSTFATVGAGNWTALGPVGNPGYTLTNDAPAGPVEKDADLIAAARAAYEAVPAKAQYAVKNYAVLVEAETPDVDVNAEAAVAVDAQILAIGDVTLDSADAIAAAREAYDALADEAKALVTELATLEAAEAELKALQTAADKDFIHDVIDGTVAPVVPQNVVAVADATTINVSWDAVDGATKYWILVDGVVVAVTTDTTYTLVKDAGTYKIAVRVALNAPYGTSYVAGTSDAVSATVTGFVPAIEYAVDGDNFTANWSAVDADIEKAWVIVTTAEGAEFIFRVDDADSMSYAKAYKFGDDFTVAVRVLVDGKIYTYNA